MAQDHGASANDQDPMLFQEGGLARDLFPAEFGSLAHDMLSSLDTHGDAHGDFPAPPIFSSLASDSPFGSIPSSGSNAPMLWQEIKEESVHASWPGPSSETLRGSVAGMSLDASTIKLHSLASYTPDATLSVSPRSAAASRAPPMTPEKRAWRAHPLKQAPLLSSSLDDDETPVKAAHEPGADAPYSNSFLYELHATPSHTHAHGLPPMTPMTEAHAPSEEQRHSGMHTHRSGQSISSSSALSVSTPEYSSAQSMPSSVDMCSPSFPIDPTHYTPLSPAKNGTVPFGVNMYTAMQHHAPPFYQHVPYTPPRSGPMHSGGLHGPISLDEPFGTPEQYGSPSMHGTPLSSSQSALYADQGRRTSSAMTRVLSAPAIFSPLPMWSAEQEMGMYPHMSDPMSFPASPASMSMGLPVNSTAIARKHYTPYSKAPVYGSDIDPFMSGMTSSKSMNALSSSGTLSPMAHSPARPRLSESTSMPGHQMVPQLDYDIAQSVARARGRNAGPPPLVVSSADKLHVCHCGRRFKRMEHLKRHNRTHTQERPHKCPVVSCGKSFGRSDNLAQHLKTHYRPAGLGGRTSEMPTMAEMSDPAQPLDRRHDPYAAAAAAAATASAASAGRHAHVPRA